MASALEGVLQQSRSPTEIVVCDAGSTDATSAIARRFADRGVRLLEVGPAYPGRARNLGVQAAAQPWIAFLDCGCVPESGWLDALVAACQAAGDADVVFGDYDPVVGGEWEAAQALVILSPRNAETGCRPPSTASMLIRKETFLRLGGFPEHLRAAEDLAFFEMVATSGIRVTHAPAARIRWSLPSSPMTLFRRLRLYSAHHAAAGLARTWHFRVLTMDCIALLAVAAGFVWPWAWALLLIAGGARVLHTVLSRRASAPPEAQLLAPGRWARVTALVVLADVACALGYFDFLRGDVASSPQ